MNGKFHAPTALTSKERVPRIHLLGHQMGPRVGLNKREKKRKEKKRKEKKRKERKRKEKDRTEQKGKKRKEEKNLFPLPGIEPQFLGLLGYSLDTIPITL